MKKIAELIHQYLPGVKTIAMYASITNIRNKTDRDHPCRTGMNEELADQICRMDLRMKGEERL